MLTLLVIIFNVIILSWIGLQISKKSKEAKYKSGKILALSLFMIVFAIFTYGVRSIVIQFGAFQADLVIYRVGCMIHTLGFAVALLFVYKEFTPKLFAWISGIPFTIILLLLALFFIFAPVTRIESLSPLEPFEFLMTNYPFDWLWLNQLFLFSCIGTPLVVLGIFLYNSLKRESKIRALFYGIISPVLLFLGMLGIFIMPGSSETILRLPFVIGILILFLAIASLFLAIITASEKRKVLKGVLYGTGIALLIIPGVLCVFFSPIYARIGYGIGGILTYRAFGMKI